MFKIILHYLFMKDNLKFQIQVFFTLLIELKLNCDEISYLQMILLI